MNSTARDRNVATDLNTKAAQRKLRELAGKAYARELGSELAKLEMESGGAAARSTRSS